MKHVEAIISDADGTLVDTVKLIRHGQYEAARQYLTVHGIAEAEIPTYDTYDALLLKTIGGSARETLERTVRLLYEASPNHLENIDFDKLHDTLNPIQDSLAPQYVTAYKGLSELLYSLGEKNIKFAIFTSGTAHHIVRNFGIALPELSLQKLYEDSSISDADKLALFVTKVSETYSIPSFTVVTESDTKSHKPDPESLELALTRLQVNAEQAAVLGDHKVDMQTAVNAHVPIRIGITHGFDDRETLLANGATATVDTLEELRAIIG